VQSSFHVVAGHEGDSICPIGRPLHNTRLYVLDEALRPLPPGRVGELFIGGAGLARGYWRRSAATAQCFVPDPFAQLPGMRMYRSGDLARWREDGALEFHGRSDGQNKLRGNRIELGEIEAALLSHVDVRQAAATICPGPAGDDQLVAHIAWLDGREGTPQQLRRHLAKQLPDYMVPSVIVAQAALPRLASGKIDRAALITPMSALPDSEEVGPRDALERSLVDLWKEVLQHERISVGDDFFGDLGGHSLLAVRLNARLNDFFQLELPLQRIFEYPTIEAYAQALRDDPVLGETVTRIEALLNSLEGAAGLDAPGLHEAAFEQGPTA
jgi:acyl carrier protein